MRILEMRVSEILTENDNALSLDTHMEGIKNEIIAILAKMREKKHFSNSDFVALTQNVMSLIERLRKVVDTQPHETGDYDKMSRFLQSKLELARDNQPLDYKVIADVLRRLYTKVVRYFERKGDLSKTPANNRDARNKIQQLAMLIHDETEEPDVERMSGIMLDIPQ